jgi:type IV pilus assembly protein PilQ
MLASCAAEVAEIPPTPTPAILAATPAEAAPPPAPPAPVTPPPASEPPPAAAPAAATAPPAPAPSAATAPPAPVAAPASAAPATGPIEVTGLEFVDGPSGGLVVRVAASGPVEGYESFTLPDPPRLVVDIPNATHAVAQPVTARSPILAARSSQYREQPVKVVRLVFDLRSLLPYQVTAVERQLRVEIGAAAAAPAATPPRKSGAKVTRVDVQQVRGRHRVVIGTTGMVPYTIREAAEGAALTIEVMDATLEPSAARSLDLRQVASPLQRVRAEQLRTEPERVVRVAAELKRPVRYEAQQTASAIVVELSGAPPAPASARAAAPEPGSTPAAPVGGASPPLATRAAVGGPKGPVAAPIPLPAPALAPASPAVPGPGPNRLSMDFKEADINNLLRIIAEVSGMNVVAGDDVRGKVTVRLVNVDWQQALDVILRINAMGYEIDGNILRVASLTKLENERRARDEAKKREEEARVAAARAKETEKKVAVQLEPLVMEVVPVNYAKADDIVKQLDRLKTKDRTDVSLVVDGRTNKLVIQETPARLEEMRKLLKELDRPTPQVLIEARLVEATRTFSQSLGVEWGFAGSAQMANLQSPQPVSIFTSNVGTTLESPVDSIPLAIAFPATSPTASVGIIAGSLLSNRLTLGVRLSAGESEGKVRTLSAPRVATLDNKQAEIKQGQQVPYTTIDSSGRTVVAFIDAFIRLKVTPHITNDRRISMEVEAERSFPGDRIDFPGGFSFPINTRKATTNVLVSNGSTVVIGGLMQSDERVSESRIPWVSKVPVLGSLFKSTAIGPEGKVELLIFLTPTILEEASVG